MIAAEAMHLKLLGLSGELGDIECDSAWTLPDLLAKLVELRGPCVSRKLFLQPDATPIRDGKSLHENGVRDGASVLVVEAEPLLLAIASSDGAVVLWNTEDNSQHMLSPGHRAAVIHACFSPDGQRVLTVSADGTGRIWNAGSHELVCTLEGHYKESPSPKKNKKKKDKRPEKHPEKEDESPPPACLLYSAFSLDGSQVATSANDQTARVWDAMTGTQTNMFSTGRCEFLAPSRSTGDCEHLAFSPDGCKLATVALRGPVLLWDLNTNQQVFSFGEGNYSSAIFADAERILVSRIGCTTSEMWSVTSGTLLCKFPLPDDRYLKAVAALNENVAAIDNAGFIHVWDCAGKLLRTVAGAQAENIQIDASTFSKDGRFALIYPRNGSAGLWDVDTGEKLHDLDVPYSHNSSESYAMDISADGSKAAILSLDNCGSVSLFDLSSGSLLGSLDAGTEAYFTAVVFPPCK
mmetsp:Transcript_1513/g.3644  ORF Transcript_1513/g.3644 Transcript_1513/m.3644 type:complete len:464 (+) Transcript_1513:17-1408(+)